MSNNRKRCNRSIDIKTDITINVKNDIKAKSHWQIKGVNT